MNTCKDCKHAKPLKEALKDRPDWLDCTLAESQWQPEHPESKAIAIDAELYRAWLVVHPDFGCVQFAEREEK